MFLEHSILTKMASSILKNSSSRLMLRQPEPRQKNSSGLLGKVMNYLKETLQKSFGKRMYISLLFLIPKMRSKWVFESCPSMNENYRMYDVDGNGWIDLEEMTRLVGSIYKMLGQHQLVQQVSQEFTFSRDSAVIL